MPVTAAAWCRSEPKTVDGSGLALRPPGKQCLARAVLAERPVLEPQLQQVVVRRSDLATLRDAQDLHDLVAVQVRPDRVQLLLLGQPVDPLLEMVVRRPQRGRLAGVPGRAVRPGQYVQPGQEVAG